MVRPNQIKRCKLLCPKKKTVPCCSSCHSRYRFQRKDWTDSFQWPTTSFHQFSSQSQADKTNTEAIDTSIVPNASPSLSSRPLLNRPLFSQIRPNRFIMNDPLNCPKCWRNQGFRESWITRRGRIKRSWLAWPVNSSADETQKRVRYE